MLKKILPVIFLTALLLCGCSRGAQSNKNTEKLPQGFCATADITYGKLALTADISRISPADITLTVNSPEQLAGMQFTYDGSATKVSYYGITFEIPKNTAAAKALAGAVFSAINDAVGKNGSVSYKDGKMIIEGRVDEGRYTLTLDEKTGAVIALSLPDLKLSCTFSDFKPLN